jgi:hypothetical protein
MMTAVQQATVAFSTCHYIDCGGSIDNECCSQGGDMPKIAPD